MTKLHKIMFIEDDEFTNEYHEFIVKQEDISEQVFFFTTAESALDYLSVITSMAEFPDLIFIDIKLPGMSGHDFIDSVRKLPHFDEAHTQLAYLTAAASNSDLVTYGRNGMKHFFFKKTSGLDLQWIIHEIFGREPENPLGITWHKPKGFKS